MQEKQIEEVKEVQEKLVEEARSRTEPERRMPDGTGEDSNQRRTAPKAEKTHPT